MFYTKAILEFLFFAFTLITLFRDFGGKIIKLILMAQFLLVKYKVNPEFRRNCTSINWWLQQKLASIPSLLGPYQKVTGMIYNYASKDIQGQ